LEDVDASLGFAVNHALTEGWHNGIDPHCADVGAGSGQSVPGGANGRSQTSVAHKPVWVDLSTSDAEAARNYYAKLFGWKVEVNPDPQYGGYALAKIAGKDVAGIGPKQSPDAPSAWMVYIGTTDAADTTRRPRRPEARSSFRSCR